MKSPLVSVIMNCYNGEDYLREAIESVISQTYLNWEIIFWDNASEDSSAEIAKSYNCNLRYFRGKKTIPLGEARDLALSKCKGEFIAFLDVDDIWMPNKLTSQIPYFDNSKVGIVTSQTVFFSDNNESIEITHNKKKLATGNVFSELMENYLLAIDSIIISKKVLSNILGNYWFNKNLQHAEEADFFMRISYNWDLEYCPKVLSKHRYHSNNLSKISGKLLFEEDKIILNSLLKLIPDLLIRFPNSVRKYQSRIAFQEFLYYWKMENAKKARKIIYPYLSSNSKYLFIYLLTIFPYYLFLFLKNINIKFLK